MDISNDFLLQKSALAPGLLELRRFYTAPDGQRKPGLPGYFFWVRDWTLLKDGRQQLEDAANQRRFLRVRLTGVKVVDVIGGAIVFKKDGPGEDKRSTVRLSPEMWDSLFDREQEIDAMFA